LNKLRQKDKYHKHSSEIMLTDARSEVRICFGRTGSDAISFIEEIVRIASQAFCRIAGLALGGTV